MSGPPISPEKAANRNSIIGTRQPPETHPTNGADFPAFDFGGIGSGWLDGGRYGSLMESNLNARSPFLPNDPSSAHGQAAWPCLLSVSAKTKHTDCSNRIAMPNLVMRVR